MTKEEILKAIRVCAKKLKRNPNKRELRAMAGITEKVLYTRVGCLRKALEAAGLRATGAGFSQSEETLLLNWAAVAKKLKKLPSVMEYQRTGRFSSTPFHKRYGSWRRVPEAFQSFARNRKLEGRWVDVLKMIAANGVRPGQSLAASGKNAFSDDRTNGRGGIGKRGLLANRPVYGAPLGLPELAYAPTNEMGVMFLFALMARRLGFVVQRLQMGFPDCEAMREVTPGHCQRIWIEIEFESRNFAKHRHRRDGCDLIVCWRHNWKECPLEVIALSDQLSAIGKPSISPRRHGGTEKSGGSR
ncbi:MAG TPA: hypothetical protein VKH81_08455 [Candidatus Angelobacter sp.]|nr:hypothetical protein [Candidatus Angelobacter sp.]